MSFRSVLTRSVATSAILGTVVAAAGLTAPATVGTAPAIERVACEAGYEAPIVTTTDVTVSPNFITYGDKVTVTASVSSVAGTPTGTVVFTVANQVFRAEVSDGTATVSPRRSFGANKTYDVTAAFVPDCADGSEYDGSGDSTTLTVYKPGSRVGNVSGTNIRKNRKPVVSARVVGDRVAPTGKARVRISKGRTSRTQVVNLRPGRGNVSTVRAGFGRISGVGTWKVSVVYLASRDHQGSSGAGSFRVRK
jgi:hypothetical protein